MATARGGGCVGILRDDDQVCIGYHARATINAAHVRRVKRRPRRDSSEGKSRFVTVHVISCPEDVHSFRERMAVVDSDDVRMQGSPHQLHLYREATSAGESSLIGTVKKDGRKFKIGEEVIQRCEALQLLFSNMCDSASTNEAELVGVDADSFLFWASTLPTDALPSVNPNDPRPASAEQVLSALQVSEFLGDELCDVWALTAAEHVLAHYAHAANAISGREVSSDVLWRAFPQQHLHNLSPRCQDLVLAHIPFCIGLSLPPSLHSCFMHIHSSPFRETSASFTTAGASDSPGLHVHAPLPPDLPFNHAHILPILSHLLSTSQTPLRSLSISGADPRVLREFPEPPPPPHPLATPDFPTLLLHFSPYLTPLTSLRHFYCNVPILKTPAAAAVLRVLPRHSLETLHLGAPDTSSCSHIITQIRDSTAFSGVHNMATFFELLERFTALRSLDISGNSLAELAVEAPSCLSAPFMFLTALTHIGLAGTGMSAQGITHIIKTVVQRAPRRPDKALQSLNISGNAFRGGGGTASLWQHMQGLTALTRLEVAACRMMAADVATVSIALRNMPALAHLSLDHNWISLVGMRRVFDALVEAGGKAARSSGRSTGALTWLSLREGPMASLGPQCMAGIAPPLRQLRALQRLDLSGHGMKVQGTTTLCGCFGALRALRELLLELNGLGDEGAAVLRDGLVRTRVGEVMRELSGVWLGGNEISEEVLAGVQAALRGLTVHS